MHLQHEKLKKVLNGKTQTVQNYHGQHVLKVTSKVCSWY